MAITKDCLRQYADLLSERDEVRGRIERLEREVDKIVQEGTVKDVVSGGMGGTQHFVIEGIAAPDYERKTRLLHQRKARLMQLEGDIDQTVADVEAFIIAIPDSLTRRIFTMRFVDGKKWRDVAQSIGGNNTEDSVKKVYQRYMGGCC